MALVLLCLLQACASVPGPPCASGSPPDAQCAPVEAAEDSFIRDLAGRRQWYSKRQLSEAGLNTIDTARTADIPVQSALGKLVPPTDLGAHDALALKLWLIGQARHTVDAAYYIFAGDLAGYAVLGALCEAVVRGVDVRLVVDASGSMAIPKSALRMLETCEEEAGYMVNAEGVPTSVRARAQVVLFNAITSLAASPNRRSHDKLLITDGEFGDAAYIVTGGRNISLDYYGLDREGRFDPHAFRDLELLLRPVTGTDEVSVGKLSSDYFSLLFLFEGNRLLRDAKTESARKIYAQERARAAEALAKARALPLLHERLVGMPGFVREGLRPSDVLLAHEMANLVNRNVVREVAANYERNPNSILYVLYRMAAEAKGHELSRYCSPYLFLARYLDKDGNVILDEAANIRDYIEANPEAQIEILTNSPLTSGNFPAQSVIDFDMAPRLLLDPELRQRWLELDPEDELEAELTNSEAWRRQVNHPRIRIYELGQNDSDLFPGGDQPYGKLHAKFWVAEDYGFVGTTNFDYRSRLYNNEMGYFFRSPPLADDLAGVFEELKAQSYRWGSPEWLQMRRNVMAVKGIKGTSLRRQRNVYKFLKATGLEWLF